MFVRVARLPVLLATLLLAVTACGTPTASRSEEPSARQTQEPEETSPRETRGPVETSAPETEQAGPVMNFASLRAHIPANTAENCELSTLNERFVIAVCEDLPEDSAVDYVDYSLAATPELLQSLYDELTTAQLGISATDTGSCPGEIPSEEPYTLGGETAGRLACNVQDGVAKIVWTDERLQVLVYADRTDGDMAALYEWWTGPDSGPSQ